MALRLTLLGSPLLRIARLRLPHLTTLLQFWHMPYVLFLLCAAIWSCSFILMKFALGSFGPWQIAAGRVAGGVGVLAFLAWRQGKLAPPRAGAWPWIIVVIVVGYAGPYVVQPLVIARQGSAFMALATAFVPTATIVVSAVLLRHWPARRQLLGVLGALCCLALLLRDGLSRDVPVRDMLLAGTVPAGYALANTLIRGWLRDIPALTLTTYQLLGTLLVLGPGASLEQTSAAPPLAACASVLVLGVLATGLATYWFNLLVQKQGPLFAGMSTNLVPLGAVVWGWADGETISTLQVAALAGILGLVLLVQYRAARS